MNHSNSMQYRTLGRTGLRVSELCLGTMTFGSRFYGIAKLDQAVATAMVTRALDHGVNFFDTADVYSFGESETLLGRALKDSGLRRDAYVIATKVFGNMTLDASNTCRLARASPSVKNTQQIPPAKCTGSPANSIP